MSAPPSPSATRKASTRRLARAGKRVLIVEAAAGTSSPRPGGELAAGRNADDASRAKGRGILKGTARVVAALTRDAGAASTNGGCDLHDGDAPAGASSSSSNITAHSPQVAIDPDTFHSSSCGGSGGGGNGGRSLLHRGEHPDAAFIDLGWRLALDPYSGMLVTADAAGTEEGSAEWACTGRVAVQLPTLSIRYGDGARRPQGSALPVSPRRVSPSATRPGESCSPSTPSCPIVHLIAPLLPPRSSVLSQLTNLHLVGNALGDDATLTLCRAVRFGCLHNVATLDLAFNQLTAVSCAHFIVHFLAYPPALPDPMGMPMAAAVAAAAAAAADDTTASHGEVEQGSGNRRHGACGLPPLLRRHRTDGTITAAAADDGGDGDGCPSTRPEATVSAHPTSAETAMLDLGSPPPLNDATNAATRIVALGLGWNDLGDAGAALVGVLLSNSGFLREVNLCHNDISPAGVELLRDGVKQCPSLTVCELGGNRAFAPVLDAINAVLLYNERHAALQAEESVVF